MEAGREIQIRKIGGKDETRRFLESLGFVIGGFVTVVSEINGNLIVYPKSGTAWRSDRNNCQRI